MIRGQLRRVLAVLAATGAVLLALAGGSAALGDASRSSGKPKPIVVKPELTHDTSGPLRSVKPKKHRGQKLPRERQIPVPAGSGTADPAVQTSTPTEAAPVAGTSFEGVQAQDSMPPDPNGAAGANAFVEIVNEQFAVYSKTGHLLYGPADTSTLWAGFHEPGDLCANWNAGDATVAYDRLANRWVIQQFAFDWNTGDPPYHECIAVSKTSDPTGEWYRYAYDFGSEFPDYPKLGVWPDGYYITYNLFANAQFFDGPEVCAYDRAKMLLGQSASQQCKPVDDQSVGGLLPSDLDGSTPPPSGSPNFELAFDTGVLKLWKFDVDWSNPGNSRFSSTPKLISVAPFSPACAGEDCIPEKSGLPLDSLGDRLMYRLAYRNFGDHESLVVSHSVDSGSTVGMRWYELRNPNGTTPTVYQQSTFAPDARARWMGSAAMDGNGDIALGYSISSSSSFPSIAYTARLAGDELGTMTQGETIVKTGAGAQTTYPRWGDYSSMSIDPSDDCTFWYTNEYLPTTPGDFKWRTYVSSFALPGCSTTAADTFSLTPSPTTVTAEQGASGEGTIASAVTNGSAQSVDLSAGALPYDTTASFDPGSVSAGDSSTVTFDVGALTPPGTYTVRIYGTGTSDIETTTLKLTVVPANAVTNGDFETGGLSGWTTGGGITPTIYTNVKKTKAGTGPPTPAHSALVGSTTSFAGDSTLSQTVLVPSGTSALTFWYQPHCKTTKGSSDQIQAQIRTTGGATLATVLAVCTNKSKWFKASFDASAYAGQTVVLWLNAHGTGAKGKGTYLLLDDVALGPAPGANAAHNGGFENGLSSWSGSGVQTPATSAPGHTGSASLRLGDGSAFDGDTTVTQTVIVPGINPTLSFWYQPHCLDTIDYDQIQVQIRDSVGQVRSVLLNACSDSTSWKQLTFDLGQYAGQSVVLAFTVHDDGLPDDPTYALFDDVSVT